MINATPDIATNYRGLLVAKVTSVRTPASGPLSGKKVYEWTEQTFSPTTGTSIDAFPPRKGVYTSATQFHNCLIDVNNADLPIGSYVWARMKGAVTGITIYETISPSDLPSGIPSAHIRNRSYQIDTGSGSGSPGSQVILSVTFPSAGEWMVVVVIGGSLYASHTTEGHAHFGARLTLSGASFSSGLGTEALYITSCALHNSAIGWFGQSRGTGTYVGKIHVAAAGAVTMTATYVVALQSLTSTAGMTGNVEAAASVHLIKCDVLTEAPGPGEVTGAFAGTW